MVIDEFYQRCMSCDFGKQRNKITFRFGTKTLHILLEEVGTDHVSDHALRFSSDVSIGRMYRFSFCRNCES